jgi:hypothetical protein
MNQTTSRRPSCKKAASTSSPTSGGPLLGATITTQSPTWKLADIGDYNGDDKDDLLFRTAAGDNKFVEANGTEHVTDSLQASWNVQHHNYEFV